MKKEFTVEDSRDQLELFQLVRALLKRVEALEKLTGISKAQEEPCVFCNVQGNHQPWCQRGTDVKRV